MKYFIRSLWIITFFPRCLIGFAVGIVFLGVPGVLWDMIGYILTGNPDNGGLDFAMNSIEVITFKDWA